MTNRRLSAIVSGRVQGVNFRWFVRGHAERLGLTGWVRNLQGNRVEVVAEGQEDRLKELVRILQQGPPMASVDDIMVDWEQASGEFRIFSIRY